MSIAGRADNHKGLTYRKAANSLKGIAGELVTLTERGAGKFYANNSDQQLKSVGAVIGKLVKEKMGMSTRRALRRLLPQRRPVRPLLLTRQRPQCDSRCSLTGCCRERQTKWLCGCCGRAWAPWTASCCASTALTTFRVLPATCRQISCSFWCWVRAQL